ncbi:MAG: FadR family transcriptional regulator [Bryobacteraceae bacterium]|nr:FadR family transcriptional regulator [Bryobacteraceae bacterium]
MLKRRTLTRQVMEYLLDSIKNGDLKPESKLPTEKELTARLGVSRTCVREAMKSLESLGMISIRPRVGAVLLKSQPRTLLNAELLAGNGQHADHLLELRQVVELGVASLAAERADDKDIAKMERALDNYMQEAERGEVSFETDMSFHRALVAAAKNPLLVEVYEMMSPYLAEGLREVADLPDEHESTIREHKKILKAVQQHNAHKAQSAMKAHLGTVERFRRVAAVSHATDEATSSDRAGQGSERSASAAEPTATPR